MAHGVLGQAARLDELQQVVRASGRWAELAVALAALERTAPADGWVEAEALAEARSRAAQCATDLKQAATQLAPVTSPPHLDLDEVVKASRKQVVEASSSAPTRPLLKLSALADQFRRRESANANLRSATACAAAVGCLLEITDARIEQAIDTTLSELSAQVARYYVEIKARRSTPTSNCDTSTGAPAGSSLRCGSTIGTKFRLRRGSSALRSSTHSAWPSSWRGSRARTSSGGH